LKATHLILAWALKNGDFLRLNEIRIALESGIRKPEIYFLSQVGEIETANHSFESVC
jgi:hypothetical protein